MQQPLLLLKTQNHCKLQRFALCFTVCFTVRFTALHSAVRVSLRFTAFYSAARISLQPKVCRGKFPISNAIKSSSGPVNLQRVCENHPSLERKACKRLTTSLLAQHYKTLLRDGLRCRCLIITSNSNSVFSSRASCQNRAHQLGLPSTLPSASATSCRSLSDEGGSLAWTRNPMTGRKLWCNHCGCHFTVPNSAAASGIHPYSANSASRTGNLFLALVPNPCKRCENFRHP